MDECRPRPVLHVRARLESSSARFSTNAGCWPPSGWWPASPSSRWRGVAAGGSVPTTRLLAVAVALLVVVNVASISVHNTGSSPARAGRSPARSGPGGRTSTTSSSTDTRARPPSAVLQLRQHAVPRGPREAGFSVAHDSWANYFKTSLSMFSTLTMGAHQPRPLRRRSPHSFGPIHAAFQARMAVPATFKSLGYEYVHIANWWEPTSRNVDADVIYRFTQESEFSTILFSTTLLSALSDEVPADGEQTAPGHGPPARPRPLRARLDRRGDPPGRPTSRSPISRSRTRVRLQSRWLQAHRGGARRAGDTEEYVLQLEYTNRRALEIIDEIIDTEPGEPDPIIILQTDEGRSRRASASRAPTSSGWRPPMTRSCGSSTS